MFILQLRLISYSSVDSFIKRDYVLEIFDKYKLNPKILERLQADQYDVDLKIFDFKQEAKRHLMNKEKGLLVQHRREYYNDFEDCLRDYKNAKIKSLQKHTKVHLSDGDNGESDSEYVDCTDHTSDLKQSSLSSKSMPHVPSGNYEDNFYQQLEPKHTAKHSGTEAQLAKAQLSESRRIEQHETPAQLTSHNNNHDQIIDTSRGSPQTTSVSDGKASARKKSITIDDSSHIRRPSEAIVDVQPHVNQTSTEKQSIVSEAVNTTPLQVAAKRSASTKRKSCRKKIAPDETVKDPTQR